VGNYDVEVNNTQRKKNTQRKTAGEKPPKSSRLKTHWITDVRQVEAFAHPARQEIIDRLVASGPLSARELAEGIGRNVTTIYHHLKHLEDVGLIQQMSSEAFARGRPYIIYKPVAPRIRLMRAPTDPELRGARIVGAQAAKEYIQGMTDSRARVSGPNRNLYLGRAVIAPSAKRLKQINELLTTLTELMLTPDPQPGPMLSIGWFLSPLDRNSHPSSGRSTKAKMRARK
jgi:predicted transcriptional regulator